MICLFCMKMSGETTHTRIARIARDIRRFYRNRRTLSDPSDPSDLFTGTIVSSSTLQMSRYGRPSAVSYSFGPGPMTPAVKAIIWANIALFVVTLFYGRILEFLGLVPESVVERLWIWQLGTYMFLHAGPLHILFN